MAKKWKSNECCVCATYILENIGNLQRAFRLTEEEIGRPILSISKSYYNKNSTLGKYLSVRNIYETVDLG